MTAPTLGDVKPLIEGANLENGWHACEGDSYDSDRFPRFVEKMKITGKTFRTPLAPGKQVYMGEAAVLDEPATPAAVRPGGIHRFWQGHARVDAAWIRTAVETTQGSAPRDWTIDSLFQGAEWVLEHKDPRERANCLRYWLLYTYGGLWLDHDVIPLASLRERATAWTAGIHSRREGSVLWFPEPRHPMLGELVDVCRKAKDGNDGLGANLLTQIGLSYPAVAIEPRVIPIASDGRATGVSEPLAVHLWHTTTKGA